VIWLGNKLKVELNNSDTSKIYRLKNENDEQEKIIVHFTNKITKDKFLSGIKTLYKSSNQLTAQTYTKIHSSFPDTKTFINDQSSKQRLFWLSKLLSKM